MIRRGIKGRVSCRGGSLSAMKKEKDFGRNEGVDEPDRPVLLGLFGTIWG